MNKVISIDEAIDYVKDGMTIMVGGFLGCGNPHRLITLLLKKVLRTLRLYAMILASLKLVWES